MLADPGNCSLPSASTDLRVCLWVGILVVFEGANQLHAPSPTARPTAALYSFQYKVNLPLKIQMQRVE